LCVMCDASEGPNLCLADVPSGFARDFEEV
jgi:hypothetical protein